MKVLLFGAHPDDIEIGCGGTEAKLLAEGHTLVHAYFTSGEAGSRTVDRKSLARTREKEAVAAALSLGVTDVRFLRFPDGLTAARRSMKIETISLIRDVRPDVVFTHSTTERFSDHKIFSELTIAAIDAAAGPWFQESSGEPHRIARVYGYEVWQPLSTHQMAVDITPYLEKKIAALQCYVSQMRDIPYDEAFRGLARYRGAMSGVGENAEVFEVIRSELA